MNMSGRKVKVKIGAGDDIKIINGWFHKWIEFQDEFCDIVNAIVEFENGKCDIISIDNIEFVTGPIL